MRQNSAVTFSVEDTWAQKKSQLRSSAPLSCTRHDLNEVQARDIKYDANGGGATVDAPFNQVVDYMNAYASVTNSNDLHYLGPVQNSNSYAFTLTEGLGFQRPDPPVSAPGSGTNSVDPQVSCTK